MSPPDAPDRPPLGSAADWMRRARSDLALASITPPPGVVYEALCFPAQQAAEKAFKAVLIGAGVRPPRTHDRDVLVTRVEALRVVPPEVAAAGGVLNRHAVQTRYPDDLGEVEETEWQQAVAVAGAVVAWAEQVLRAPNS